MRETMTDAGRRFARLRTWGLRLCLAVACVAGAAAGPAGAQTADDLFAPFTIRDIRLTMSERDWAALREHYLENTYYTCDVRVVLGGQEAVVRNAGVRSRGTGSRSGTKPALKIDISRYVKGQRFLGLRSIILRNLLQDASMVHEYVTFELERRLGLPVPRTVFVRLFVNDAYAGLYEAIEDVDEEFLDRVNGEHAGYLYEYAWLYPYYFQYLGPDLERYAELWEPKTRDSEPAGALWGPFEALSRTLEQTRPEDVPSALGGAIDVSQVLRLAAADNFMADWDGVVGYAGLNNIYLYRPLNGPAFVVPWDKDNTFHALDYGVFEGTGQNLLTARALANPRLRAEYVGTLRRAMAFSSAVGVNESPLLGPGDQGLGWLEGLVEAAARLIRKSAWSDPFKPYTNQQFEAAIADAKRFARLRAGVVDAQLAGARAVLAGAAEGQLTGR